MQKSTMRLLLCVLCVVTVPQAGFAQSVIKLFSTPAERAELERRRLMLARPESVAVEVTRPVEIVELPALAEEPVDVIITLGGAMLRGDGTYTIWINGAPVNQEELPEHMELLAPFAQGKLRISNHETGQSYEVKPGQVLNLTTGELMESYETAQMGLLSAPQSEVSPAPALEADLDEAVDTSADELADPAPN